MSRYTLPFLGTTRPNPGTNEPYDTTKENASFDQIDVKLADVTQRSTNLETARASIESKISGTLRVRVASDAARLTAIPAPKNGDQAERSDKNWTEEYFDATVVTTAGWYPVSGRMPSLELRKNTTDTTFGGGAWSVIRDNWGFITPVEVNANTFLKYETGCIKTILPGEYEFTYGIDVNLTSGAMIMTITASTAAHVQADNLVLARGTFDRSSGTAGGTLTVRKTLAANQFVQGNINPEANGVVPGTRPQGNFVQARYIGPPFKA